MQLTKKHYAGILAVVIIVLIVLVSQFPLQENTEGYITDENFFEDINDENAYLDDFVFEEIPEKIPLNFNIQTTGCLGQIKNNEFIPDERSPTEEEVLDGKPKVTAGNRTITAEFFGGMYCNASKIDVNAFVNTDGKILIEEMETVDYDKFVFGPTTAPPEERWICLCYYKSTVEVTGLKAGNYKVVVERKDDLGSYFEVTVK
ncbi:hypothetical protein KKG83_04890 [Candidatus Micrarchaeota archaeon]|nr:hypothetical protein [Candidatus Micrarchaeota archaeon]